jgi:uncharacterized protein (DUF4415 family)
MTETSALAFVLLVDGTILQRGADGRLRAVSGLSDLERLANLSEEEIEAMASSDADHPGLDDAVLDAATRPNANVVELDPDIVDFFQRDGSADRKQINAVLRRFVDAQRKAG